MGNIRIGKWEMKKFNIVFIVILALYSILTLIKFILAPGGLTPLFRNLVISTALIMGIFAYCHAIYTLKKKAIVFILIVVGVAIIGEIIFGVKAVQGGSYQYTSFLPGPRIGGVPLFIPVIMHMTTMYLTYCVINYIFSGDRKNLRWPIIAILAVAYGFCELAIDAGREVIYGAKGFLGVWFYPKAHTYFGVAPRTPIKWFLWATVLLGIFLIYESRISKAEAPKPDSLPVIAFFLFALTLMSEALVVGHPEFALIQAALMFPFVSISLLVASRTWKDRKAVETSKST